MFKWFKRRPDPETVIDKLCEAIPKDLMVILDSYPYMGFKWRLLSRCSLVYHRFKFKFRTWEEALPKVEDIIAFGLESYTSPISDDDLDDFCTYVIINLFYEI